jgi:uridine kinase
MNNIFPMIAEQILRLNGRAVVGVDGKDGSGKTLFATNLTKYLRAHTEREIIHVSLDDFFNPRKIREQNPNEPQGNYDDTFDYKVIRERLLSPFKVSGNYITKSFDCESDLPVSMREQASEADAIMVIDGLFLQKPELSDFWNLTILLQIDDDVAIDRGSRRDTERGEGDIEAVRRKYINRYIPSQKIYYTERQPQLRADIVLDNTEFESPKVLRGI